MFERLLQELKPSKVLMDQGALDDLYSGIMTGQYKFAKCREDTRLSKVVELCQKSGLNSRKMVMQGEVQQISGKFHFPFLQKDQEMFESA